SEGATRACVIRYALLGRASIRDFLGLAEQSDETAGGASEARGGTGSTPLIFQGQLQRLSRGGRFSQALWPLQSTKG
ncbi:MAG: hypothetical protein WA724_10190, partial [Candidatus Dormiibacterota bacterium]